MRKEKAVRRGGMWTADGFLFEQSGGDLSLDFVNTVDTRPSEKPTELLSSYSLLTSWARQAGLISPDSESALNKKAKRSPAVAQKALKQAVAARECLFRILYHLTNGEDVPHELLKHWNVFVQRTADRYVLISVGNNFFWRCTADPKEFDSLLWPIIHAAVALLTGPNVSRIRRCSADNCDWMFLDTSKRGNRRWCDMTVCGNRAKARRFYSKKKSFGVSPT